MGLAPLLADLAAEQSAVDDLVSALPAEAWDAPTAAAGWSVRHQISHLAFFDEQVVLSAADPEAFAAGAGIVVRERGSFDLAGPYVDLSPGELLARWRAARAAVQDVFAPLDPKARLPWYGPSMSARSSLTARLMETWAHGVDIADGLGAPLAATDRLRNVAHLGVTTRGWSFAVRGAEAPIGEVRVELDPPGGGEAWTWGDDRAADRVAGPALDFCLVVTQRRPLAATALRVTPGPATEWLSVAQAFAGAPTTTDAARATARRGA